MATINFTDPLFSDEDKARAWLESQRWPDGATCPFCGSLDDVKPLDSKAHGAGWYHCNACRKLFTVRVGSVMERSHIPLTKWALVFHLMAASKKGVSAKQVQRMCGFKSYKSAWFMYHRIRSALGIEDTERASRMIKGAVGRRLTYRRPDAAAPLADDGVPF